MTKALVKELRAHECGCGGACGQRTPSYIAKAADHIEAISSENERLKKELLAALDKASRLQYPDNTGQ